MCIKSMALRERLQPFYMLFISFGSILSSKLAYEWVCSHQPAQKQET